MGINFDKALGIHPHTLNLRTERAKVLAGNLANVDTPGFKARDFDFQAAIASVEAQQQSRSGQVAAQTAPALQYRNPYNNTMDGNTVELGVEQAQYAQNAMDFETSLTFLNMKFQGLATAIQGQ
ncbi:MULTISPECIES: flagellar basal body rod protein FlgB [Photobacterium]|uniref:Flagellar basal body rod protein FlgB n=1 Tax=Photobacterium pectinilyticum TaxID=2906793 RepID=A0ABT1MYG1_9GAMM|nr:flagellar basal body rod protein FlgB [Photobacterium sp. ZSDE20]MCQ1057424.1 flagellar basal body rod protein FlgB [Photobacterium sp. ZSDE20]MDD1821627.1 flagellar basal body rod protein FlgB [Photobacterium sp. ZSDE20]